MNTPRHALPLRHTIAAALLVCCVQAPLAWSQAGDGPGNNYYPALNSPIENDPALLIIQQKLSQMFRKTKNALSTSTGGYDYTVPTLLAPVPGAAPYPSVPAPPTPPGSPFPVIGYSLVNEAELNTALGQAVTDLISAAPGAYAGSLQSLVNRTANYRKATVGKYVSGATAAVTAFYTEATPESTREAAIEAIAIGAISAEPTQASAVVGSMLKVVAPTLKASVTLPNPTVPNAFAADDIVEKAVELSAKASEVIVKTAITTVKTVIDSNDPDIAKKLIQNIAAEAINTAFDSSVGAGYLGQKIAVQIGLGVKAATRKVGTTINPILNSQDVVSAIFGVDGLNPDDSYTVSRSLATHPEDIKNVALVAAGLMKGFSGSTRDGNANSTTDPSTHIVEAIDSTLQLTANSLTAQKNYLNTVKAGFDVARLAALPTDATSVSGAVGAAPALTANKTNLAAYVTGASAWLEKAIPLFIANVLNADAQQAQAGTDSVKDIVEAAVRGGQSSAAKIVLAAANWGKQTDIQIGGTPESARLGQILAGAALGLKGQPLYNTLVPASAAAILKANPMVFDKVANKPVLNAASVAVISELAGYGTLAVQDAGRPSAISFLVKQLQLAAAKDEHGFETILTAVIGNSTPANYIAAGDQWRAILGSMVGDKIHSGSIRSWATANLGNYDALQNGAAVQKGGDLVAVLQVNPKRAFAEMFNAFSDPALVGVEKSTLAVLTGAGLVSPASTAAAAALAIKFTDAAEASIRAEASVLNAAQSKNIGLTITAAVRARTSTLTLFDDVEQLIFQNPRNVNDVVTGATIVAPNYAHIIAHATGFRAPSSAAKAVPLLFNYSHLTSTDPKSNSPLFTQYDNTVDAAAAITAGITAGIVEAKTNTLKKPTTETTFLKTTVAALVKQALVLSGNTPVGTQYLPNIHNGNVLLAGEGASNFKNSNGDAPDPTNPDANAGGYVLGKQLGAAGVMTGVISQILDPAGVLSSGPNAGKLPANSPIAAVISAAISVVKKSSANVLAVAQAAAQSIKWMAPAFGAAGQAEIVAAVQLGLGTLASIPLMAQVTNAVNFGVLAAAADIPAAGAAGVINFTHRTASGLPVTDIFEL